MNAKRKLLIIFAILAALSIIAGVALAEDGAIFRRNVSKTPDMETEKAAVYMMDFYVPAQRSDGTVGPVDNYCEPTDTQGGGGAVEDGACTTPRLYDPRDYAKPLVSAYIDGIPLVEYWDESDYMPMTIQSTTGGIVLGAFDAFIGVSLDDGTTWRTENLSRSADLSSFTLANGHEYPGGVHALVHQVAEDKILVAWASKYCQSGYPLYAMTPDDTGYDAGEQEYLADLEATYGKNALYLYDLFGVGGNQGSVNYTEQGWPEVGEVPYSCIWTARGKLLPGDDPKTADVVEATHVVWMAPERLTSGVRDANLPAVDCAKGAGCALTWQEDPEGLRPGKGLGPGEGWSGAIANAKTDIWYSYISFNDFDIVGEDLNADGAPDVGSAITIEEYELAKGTDMDRPKPYVPMAIPVRLTDNDMCKKVASVTDPTKTEDPFCWIDFDTIDNVDNTNVYSELLDLTGPEEGADFCATSASWVNSGGTTLDICITENGRWMIGRVASTRVRMVLKPYFPDGAATDLDGDSFPDDGSAWLSLAAEETKALGITVEDDEEFDPVDIGKNMYYYSFDYAKPYNLSINTQLMTDEPKPYVVQQGGMINEPAKCSPWFITTDQTHPDISCEVAGGYFDTEINPITGYEYYLTEIARRFALTENNISNITDPAAGGSGLASMLIYKQGIIFQGGPADIMLRRVVVQPFCTDTDGDGIVDNTDECFDKATENPYAFKNMECVNPDGTSGWVYPADVTDQYPVNPYYLEGLCMAPAINISGSTIATCDGADTNDGCAALFPVADDGTIPDGGDGSFPKVREWRQCDGISAIEGCEADNDLDDQSWENPYDVAKGHRGFLYGDFVMMMYAWSPNWQSNAVGNDHYNLYQRRSFDGGKTWTTTPAELGGVGLDALEFYYGETIGEFVPYVWSYGPGEFEQARNLSLLHGNKVTILDPRYSPPGGLKQYSTISPAWLTAKGVSITSDQTLPYEDDLEIDPSKYYLVYETGDNTTVDVGEAIPLDLYYTRATDYGDTLEWFDYVNDELDGNPVAGIIDGDLSSVEPRWPWLENAAEDLSGEASVVLNPGGTFAYNVWNQWREDIFVDEFGIEHELVHDSDMIFRRLLWVPDDYTVPTEPLANILYVSASVVAHNKGGDLILAGTGKEIDKLGEGEGIVEFLWTSDLQGTLGNSKVVKIPVTDLSIGTHTIVFKVKDNDGVWSTDQTVKVVVLENLYQVLLPSIIR